jgi:acyl carrier protein
MHMSARLTVISQMEQVAKEQNVELPPLSDALALSESGLDSLGFAILVSRLEDALGFDPFAASEEAYFPVTLGDFVRVYDDAAKHAAKNAAKHAGKTPEAAT